MKTMLQQLTDLVSAAFEACGYDPALGRVGVSNRPDLCQFQCNGALTGAKLYHKAPFMIADEVAKKLQDEPIFSKVEMVKPGFLNLTLSDEHLAKEATDLAASETLGIPQAENAPTIVMDYGGPNVAKPLHIGHLRSAIIGESLKRIARAMGYRVVADVHLGDWGLQIGLVIAELSERHPEWRCFAADFDPNTEKVPALDVDLLNEVYPFASKKSKTDEAFAEKAHRMTFELQTGNPGCTALWQEILRVSIADLKGSYEKLGVDFDLWYGESNAEAYVEPLLATLREQNLLHESEGAQVVDVEESDDKAPVPPVIIKKSDNSNIYATTDLATIIQREEDFHPAAIWYVVDKRQGLHFTQVFRCARKAHLVPEDCELSFLGFGTMNGSDGKPYKTRDGGVMRLSDLLATVEDAAAEKMNQSSFVSAEEQRDTARKVGIAAIKFGDLINHRSKDYIFDLDRFLSFEGKTGTYLLYTITRIHSILEKLGVDDRAPITLSGVYTDAERDMLLNILQTGEVFTHALDEKAPNYICENAYKLANLFSSFYHDNHIATESDPVKQQNWISLCRLTSRMLQKQLDVLGIESVKRM